VVAGDPSSTRRDSVEVWKLDAEPGELRLPRDKHNYMMNFVFVPGSGGRK